MSGVGLDATATGVSLRELHHLEELEEVYRLLGEIWQSEPGNAPISVELMRALSHAGNYITGAYLDGRMIGASVGFLAAPAGRALHSHITGTTLGNGVGFALKQHQRLWALERGLDTITWTYDPLVRRNAHFNLAKLGAFPTEYLPSFYGVMGDAINAGDESDRVLATWPLAVPHVAAAAAGTPYAVDVPVDAVVGLRDRDGRPAAGRTDAEIVLIDLPADIETLRHTDPSTARAWRQALREVLGGLMARGAQVVGFHRKSSYVVRLPA
ncbi:GNAT family N-acetyltransferase [Streptosporangium sp. NPDC001559]|uniref:GNAT family N-acetyltransferase n=1 Tax=Streptosporangium sp. NPDC001559 TaxID=3366187 RepID=UPI0036E033DB